MPWLLDSEEQQGAPSDHREATPSLLQASGQDPLCPTRSGGLKGGGGGEVGPGPGSAALL